MTSRRPTKISSLLSNDEKREPSSAGSNKRIFSALPKYVGIPIACFVFILQPSQYMATYFDNNNNVISIPQKEWPSSNNNSASDYYNATTDPHDDVNTTTTTTTTTKGYVCEPVTHPERRPELIHITKTGGTSLEIVGAMYNIPWGACHWVNTVDDMDDSLKCPANENGRKKYARPGESNMYPYGSIWHVPPKWMKPHNKFWLDGNATLFTVVRDPYARAVSSYNYFHKRDPINATAMNLWLNKTITLMDANRPVNGSRPSSGAYFSYGVQLIPQIEYVTNDVRILRTETLQRDFLCMMRGHGYDWEWPTDKIFNKSNKRNRLAVANLTSATRSLIAKAYREDFEQFGYQI